MPLYEYECGQCHRRTEKIQKFSDPEITVCPHCGGPLERTITAAAISFKGGGWYKDLYSSAKPSAASSSEASGSGTSDSGSSDSSSDSSSASTATPASGSAASAPSAAPAAAPSAPATSAPAKS